MSSQKPASLRDLYNPPASSWQFHPPSTPPPLPSSSSSPSIRPVASYDFPRHRTRRSGVVSLENAGAVANAVVFSALAQFSSTAIAMPFEVGKTLLQVQWVPRDASASAVDPGDGTELDEDDADVS
jgi:fusion and transport protein UGO1